MYTEKYRELFVDEAREHIQNLNKVLLKLEKDPDKPEHIDSLFRSAHTIKGMAKTMGYNQVSKLSEAIEDILGKIRSGTIKISTDLVNPLFKSFDILDDLVKNEGKKVDLKPYLDALHQELKFKNNEKINESSQLQQTSTIRVKMEYLDSLVDLVGQIIIARMRLGLIIRDIQSEESLNAFMNLDRLISDLQVQTMQIRLVPLNQLLSRFSRMVRDLAINQDKKIDLQMEGLDIELDRSLAETIVDPILHLLRNAVDHGIETSSERKKKKKPITGIIKLSAVRVGDRIELSVEDDGKGIDLEKIKSDAITKGMVTKDKADLFTNDEIINLIGTPGLSSSDKVTDISGRGVGINVVRNRMEKIGGRLKVSTTKDKGSRFDLTIPLSLSIISGLIVKVSNQRFILPLSCIVTTLQIENKQIQIVDGKETLMYMEKIIPLINVADNLRLKTKKDNIDNKKITIIIINKDEKKYGLIIDYFETKQDIVVKRLESSGDRIDKFSTASILPDGSVILILDPSIILEQQK